MKPDGSLRPRKFADALITDPAEAAEQAVRLVNEGRAQTLCIHSDTPGGSPYGGEAGVACGRCAYAGNFTRCTRPICLSAGSGPGPARRRIAQREVELAIDLVE